MRKLKIILAGESGVGKTAFIDCFIENESKVEASQSFFHAAEKTVEFNGDKFALTLQEINPHPDYSRMRPLAYVQTDIILLFFDLANKNSLHDLKDTFVAELQHHLEGIPIILVGTKSDLVVENAINPDDLDSIKKLCNEYFETSAKLNENIEAVIMKAIELTLPPPEHKLAEYIANELTSFKDDFKDEMNLTQYEMIIDHLYKNFEIVDEMTQAYNNLLEHNLKLYAINPSEAVLKIIETDKQKMLKLMQVQIYLKNMKESIDKTLEKTKDAVKNVLRQIHRQSVDEKRIEVNNRIFSATMVTLSNPLNAFINYLRKLQNENILPEPLNIDQGEAFLSQMNRCIQGNTSDHEQAQIQANPARKELKEDGDDEEKRIVLAVKPTLFNQKIENPTTRTSTIAPPKK